MTRTSGSGGPDPRPSRGLRWPGSAANPSLERAGEEAPLTHEDAKRFAGLSLELRCVIGFDGRFRRLDPQWGDLLGFDRGELVSRDVLDFIHPDDVTTIRDFCSSEPAGAVGFECRCRRADGSHVWLRWNAVADVEESAWYAVARDVTELKEREAELRLAEREVDRARAVKTELLQNLGHEIRTPMNGIIGMTRFALETDLTGEQRGHLETVETSALALMDVLNSLLEFAEIGGGGLQMKNVDFALRDTVSSALKPLSPLAARRGTELVYDECEGVPPRLCGDPGRLKQVLVHLVGNAIKFTVGGQVRVALEGVRERQGSVELEFEVSDTGVGIAPDKLELIFEPFAQGDGGATRAFGGAGLGLSIASAIVRTMGGEIRAESEEGQGSSFRFTVRLGVGREPARPPTLPTRDLSDLRVLIADDHDVSGSTLEGFLGRRGMRTRRVSSGAEAIAALEAAHGRGDPIGLALVDARMRGTDDFELIRLIRSDPRFDGVVLVALTSTGRPGDGAICEELGVSGYLLTPLMPGELCDAIQLALADKERPVERRKLVTRHSLRETWQSLRVLLAEDNRVNQALAIRSLERLGHTVELAQNGREAVERFAASDFDLVLMDLQMPEMGGLEATARIRELEAMRGGHTPIVAVTANGPSESRADCLERGMDEYLAKPIDQERLREVVRFVSGLKVPAASGATRT